MPNLIGFTWSLSTINPDIPQTNLMSKIFATSDRAPQLTWPKSPALTLAATYQ
jgi:hypothetical protein